MTASLTTRRQLVALAATTTLGLPFAAQAAYPEKPITFVVPFAAASATDQLSPAAGRAAP